MSLSDNRVGVLGNSGYLEEDVKEFIKELKEIEIESYSLGYGDGAVIDYEDFRKKIDELAGDKLIDAES